MVLRRDGETTLCIHQSEHARISGQVARAWGGEDVEPPKPATELAMAAAHHDDGMEEYDRAPALDPESGLPLDFMSMPLRQHLECWRRGPELVASRNGYAGILVSLHGTGLMERKRTDGEGERALVEDYLEEQRNLRDRLAAAVAGDDTLGPELSDRALERNRSLLALWDAISLAVCIPRLPDTLSDTPAGPSPVRLELGELERRSTRVGRVSVEPWPFATERVELSCEGRRLRDRFEHPEQLHRALEEAPRERLEVELVPGG